MATPHQLESALAPGPITPHGGTVKPDHQEQEQQQQQTKMCAEAQAAPKRTSPVAAPGLLSKSGTTPQQQQQQAQNASGLLPSSPTSRIVPLPLAMRNVQCVCLGKPGPAVGAWRGCNTNPWCNKEGGHTGDCNCRASIPGLAAYSPSELESAGIQADMCLPDGEGLAMNKRKAVSSLDEITSTVSDNHSNTEEADLMDMDHMFEGGDHTKRSRRMGSGPAMVSRRSRDDPDGDSTSEELRSTTTAEGKLSGMLPDSVTGRNRSRNGLDQGEVITKAAAGAPRAEPVGRGAPGGRGAGRKTQRQWVTDAVVDPRTGEHLTQVPPASFCTQCSTLSTPVWRAGPFGHKTLCNACGVRWMKVAPKLRK